MASHDVLAALQEKIEKMRAEAEKNLRDAVELSGSESGYSKYQRGVLYAIQQVKKTIQEG